MLAKRNSQCNLLSDFFGDELMGGIFPNFSGLRRKIPSELTEKDGNYVLYMEVPGIEDIKITYKDDYLTISAEKTEGSDNIYWTSRSYGKIEKTFRIPDVDPEGITAKYSKGILTVTLGKLEEKSYSKEITVECCD